MPHIGNDYQGAPLTLTREGFCVVEPNHLSAPRTGQVYAMLPANEDIDILENGASVKYDYAAGETNFDGNGPWYMVFNEEKLYDERYQMHKDYAMQRNQFYDNIMVPRVLAYVLGDTYTTNAFVLDETTEINGVEVPCKEITVGDCFSPDAENNGLLKKDDEGFIQAVSLYTMPDGQPGVKVQVIKNQPAIQ